MKSAAEEWLVQRASPAGMMACGLRAPDGRFICHSLEAACPPEGMEKILGQFAGLQPAFYFNKLSPRWSTWSFEQGRVRFVERPDGWLLSLVARPASEAGPRLDALCEEFLGLELGD